MPTIEQLKTKTNEFFDLHWPKDEPKPEWWKQWHFVGDIPNNEKPGCYALLKDDKIVYVGVGAGQGSGIYKDAGLGSRLSVYWNMSKDRQRTEDGKRKYIKNPAIESDFNSIITIGFSKYGYLSYALEIFLIRNLDPQPEINRIGKKT